MSLDVHFHQRLVKRLKDETVNQIESLVAGQLEPPAYKFQSGYIKALRDVFEWCEEIDKQLSEGK